MQSIYTQNFSITDIHVDCWGRLKPSMVLLLAQEVAGTHFTRLAMDYQALAEQGLFWAVSRHKVQITRLPRLGETIRLETWPMPTTRVAYPRSVVAYDADGAELFRAITLWVLLDIHSRSMVLPGKSGVQVPGTLRGGELSSPLGLPAKVLARRLSRTVCFTDLDRNGHMNNTRYLDWIADLLPSGFHRDHPIKELTVCYLTEAREGDPLDLHWELLDEYTLQVEATRLREEKTDRVFAARWTFDNVM